MLMRSYRINKSSFNGTLPERLIHSIYEKAFRMLQKKKE